MNRTSLFVAVVVMLLVAQPALAAVTDIDDKHSLVTDDKKRQYEDEGVARAYVNAPEMTITAAKGHEACDVDGFHSDRLNDYLCVNYKEDIPRDIRLYIPKGYFGVHSGEEVSIEGDTRATFKGESADGKNLIVVIHADGPFKATWKLHETSAAMNYGRDKVSSGFSNLTGVGMAGSDWQYVDVTQLQDGTFKIEVKESDNPEDVLVQYEGNDAWLNPGEDSETRKPVYVTTRTGENAVYVHSTSAEDVPQVRYKLNAGAVDNAKGFWAALNNIPRELGRIFDSLPF